MMPRPIICVCVLILALVGAVVLPSAAYAWIGEDPTPTPAPTPAPSAAPYTGPLDGDPGASIPWASPPAPAVQFSAADPSPSPGPVDRVVIARACLDENANDWCDVNEGVAGVTVYFLDAETGVLLTQPVVTDSTGTAQRVLRVDPAKAITMNMPYLGRYRTITEGQFEPELVEDIPALPGLLP